MSTFSSTADFSNTQYAYAGSTADQSSQPGVKVIREVVHIDASEDDNYASMHDGETLDLRRWAGAKTNRLNADQWSGVHPTSINFDIEQYMPTLRARCRHEAYNNPIVAGVINTYSIDLIGKSGPTLRVESDDEEFNRHHQEVWQEFFEDDHCEVSGLTGLDLLRRHIWQSFTDGPTLTQILDQSGFLSSDKVVKDRLLDISPDRLVSPAGSSFDSNIVLGIKRDPKTGRALQYFILDPSDMYRYQAGMSITPKPYSADDILHVFDSYEPGQATGIPKIASFLQDAADLRSYDEAVLDAARAAAENGVIFWTRDMELCTGAKAFKPGQTMEVPRRSAMIAPPGYEPTQMNPAHPASNYVEFRHEKMRNFGRVVHMPLLMILLSAEGSNFSQSRIDVNVIYERGLNVERGLRERKFLTPLAKNATRAMKLATTMTKSGRKLRFPKIPKNINYRWDWEPLPQANPKDAALVMERMLALGLTSLEIEASKQGIDLDKVIKSRQKTEADLESAGLPTMTDIVLSQVNTGSESDDESSDDKKKSTPKKSQNVKVGNSRYEMVPNG